MGAFSHGAGRPEARPDRRWALPGPVCALRHVRWCPAGFDLSEEQVRAIGAILSRGEGFYVEIASGAVRELVLPSLVQQELGAAWVLGIDVPLKSPLFAELSRTGHIRVLGDEKRNK